jgi:flagellar basal-body rod modification protein FlgD
MTTTPINSGKQGTQMKNKTMNLQAQDFIKMMITQLQNQDPMEPAKNSELLAQMSQIGQLQSSTALNESLKSMVLQSQIGSAGNLIGKNVEGMDETSATVRGVVNSVKVESGSVFLELDTGKRLALDHVTAVAAASTATAVTPGAAAGSPTAPQTRAAA